ncbi:hypothetical protein ACU4GD_15740 [Cupriavidus basilensis]
MLRLSHFPKVSYYGQRLATSPMLLPHWMASKTGIRRCILTLRDVKARQATVPADDAM